MPHTNSKNQISLPIIVCLGIAVGVLIGSNLHSIVMKSPSTRDTQKVQEVLNLIKHEYVDNTSPDVLVDDVLTSLLQELDPHSAYISSKDRALANEDLKGNFEGIGIEFNIFRDTLIVISALSGGPSEAVGLRSGDKIITVNDSAIVGASLTNLAVQRRLKGPAGTKVKLEVIRKNKKKPLLFTIVRDKIPQFSIDAFYLISPEIGYIKVSHFSQTTHEELLTSIGQLNKEGMKKLILDLQGNPGGYMDQAIAMADEFLSAGKKIVFTDGDQKKYNENAMATNKGIFETGDLIVLINEGSASASEIVSGALQDNDRALIVGRRSFGKGLVQRPFTLQDGSEIRLTISRYYTPSGRSIQKPYDENSNEYNKEIVQRYKHGEFFTADSIKFNDSLKYKTLHGRTVYGGGGIMPDFFVPLDTTLSNHYFNELSFANVLREYAFHYGEQEKEKLQQIGFKKYEENFVISDAMLKEVMLLGQTNHITPNPHSMNKNKKIFQLYLKAEIARRVWGNRFFYPIFNQTNEVLQQAIKLFNTSPDITSEICKDCFNVKKSTVSLN